jgi:hypothetical protein
MLFHTVPMPGKYCLILLAIMLAGCSTTGLKRNIEGEVPVQKAIAQIPEDQLLDVWIELFDAGELPEDEEDVSGLSMDIRKAEARYMPEQLRHTVEKTGYWGAVRVVPQGTEGSEVLVRGKILVSDGENLELEISALDANGRVWFTNTYKSEATVESYRATELSQRNVFQSLYNSIANDLADYRNSLQADEIVTTRRIAALRFAADIAPNPFANYLQRDDNGDFTILRLPADNDPMYLRVNAIRERDYLLIDTLNGHFNNFYREMQNPYGEWRRVRTEEVTALREIKSQATKRKILGGAAILGAIALEAFGGSNTRASTGALRSIMVVGGAYAIKTGFDKDSETIIHRDAIEELGESFAAEARPLVVEVEGETHELTGSAEAQYAEWRTLLKRIYASETGLTDSTD